MHLCTDWTVKSSDCALGSIFSKVHLTEHIAETPSIAKATFQHATSAPAFLQARFRVRVPVETAPQVNTLAIACRELVTLPRQRNELQGYVQFPSPLTRMPLPILLWCYEGAICETDHSRVSFPSLLCTRARIRLCIISLDVYPISVAMSEPSNALFIVDSQ